MQQNSFGQLGLQRGRVLRPVAAITSLGLLVLALAACKATCRPGTIMQGGRCVSPQKAASASEAADAGADSELQITAGAGGAQSASRNDSASGPAGNAGGARAAAGDCVAEVCDNVDNDCDGKVDESVMRACGPQMAIGVCKPGTQACSAGQWSECQGAVEAKLEACDAEGLDENCDGAVNEGCGCTSGATQACGDADGACKQGTQTCENGRWSTECVGMVGPTKEVCDAAMVDEDCDGVPNQNCECTEGAEEPCPGKAEGECVPGTRSCSNGRWSSCAGVVTAKSEKCDSADNDCDGRIDEDSCTGTQQCVRGRCVDCETDADCAAMSDECNAGVCQSGSCRRTAKTRGTKCGSGLCDNGSCKNVECFSASDCSGSGARCTDGQCAACGDKKVSAGEQCDVDAPKEPGDDLASSTYDEFSCDARTCQRLYLYTPCSVDSMQASSSQCGGMNRCSGTLCMPNAGCNGDGPCTLANGKSGLCYGNACLVQCNNSNDCPATFTCREQGVGRICN